MTVLSDRALRSLMDFLAGQYDEMSIYTSYELWKYAAVFTNFIDCIEDYVFENCQTLNNVLRGKHGRSRT